MNNESQVSVPLRVRLRFGHAAVQRVADDVAVDVLHIKGAAADPRLRPGGYAGNDVDVLIRPDHIDRLDTALRSQGWRLYSTFANGSPFGHAQTYLHDAWGYVDIHRYFPGIRLDSSAAFDLFWTERHGIVIAGVECQVPSVSAQAVLLVLNAARSRRGARSDTRVLWTDADESRRAEISQLAETLQARVAFAAATGDLDRYRDDREYRLWKVVSQGGSRAAEWRARIVAAPTLGAAVGVALRATLVNVDSLSHRLGRVPSRRDVLLEFFRRPMSAIIDASRAGLRWLTPRNGGR